MLKLGFGPNLTRFLGVREFTMGLSSGLYMDFTGLKKNKADIHCYKSRFSKYSVQFSHSVMSDSLRPHGLQAHQACMSITNSQSLLKFMSIESVMASNHPILCHPFSSCLQSFPESGSFPTSQFFASGDQSIGASASASVLPMNIQG